MAYILLNQDIPNGNNLEGSYSGNLIIAASAECLWDDYLRAKELVEDEDLMCVNLAAICFYYRHIDHLVTLHHEGMRRFYAAAQIERRARSNRDRRCQKIITHSYKEASGGVDVLWDITNPGGTSGLFAATVAVRLGYDKIILCGMPIDNSRRFYDSPNKVFKYSGLSQQDPWQNAARTRLEGKVRSMSGNTRKILGEPTKDWLTA